MRAFALHIIDIESELWHRRHMVLAPYYLERDGRMKALSLWFKCVRRCPIIIKENIKTLLLSYLAIDISM